MEPILIVIGMIALLAAWQFWMWKHSRGRMWSPLWMAFSLAFVALLYLVGVTRN
jgi:hypothetical protein